MNNNDHRVIGKELDLFHFQDEAPGMVFWHPNGWELYRTIENYIRDTIKKHGYQEVKTPQLVDMSLWEKSGHASKFSSNMFTLTDGEKNIAVKPMNCPCHVQLFNHSLRSYKELPLRIAEFGSCHRNEPSGSLHGLMRVRGFTQDDAHIFCTEEQIEKEVTDFICLVHEVYSYFGFSKVKYNISTRPAERVGSDELWDKAEESLKTSMRRLDLDFGILEGEGAFYGPKIEFTLTDNSGRDWQVGTIQVDFSMPGRLNASYIDADGNRQVPVMLHRAIIGSFERFIGILLEHHDGKLPFKLAPVQVMVLPVSDKNNEYCEYVSETLTKYGIRNEIDRSNNTIGYKVRHHTDKKVPIMLILGNKEESGDTVSIRRLDGTTEYGVPLDRIFDE